MGSLLWWVLSGGDPASWLVGIPVVLTSSAISMALPRGGESGFSIRGWAALVPVFLWQSLLGAWDVARRVLSPRLPVDPGFFEYRLGLRGKAARWLFLHLINLMPGTLSARLDGDLLIVHALNLEDMSETALRGTEKRVAAAFGETLAR